MGKRRVFEPDPLIPLDLTQAEADKIARVIRALAKQEGR